MIIHINIFQLIVEICLMYFVLILFNYLIITNLLGEYRIKKYETLDKKVFFIIEEISIFGWRADKNCEWSMYDFYTETKKFISYEDALNFFSSNIMYSEKKLIENSFLFMYFKHIENNFNVCIKKISNFYY